MGDQSMEKPDERHHVKIQSVCRMGGCVLVLMFSLSGCGNPTSDRPPAVSGQDLAGTSAASDRTDADTDGRQALSKPVPAQSIGHPEPKSGGLPLAHSPLAVAPRAPQASPVNSPSSGPLRDEAEQAQWQAWYAAAREHPDVNVRLQALEQWVQQPGTSLDPLTYALVDGDEDVRARAQDLWARQLTRDEAAAAQPTNAPRGGLPAAQ